LLPAAGVISGIIAHKNSAYDFVYLYGNPQVTTAVVNTLMADYSAHHQNARIMRTSGPQFLDDLLQNIKAGKPYALPDGGLLDCDLFVFEGIDSVAGRMTAEQRLYGMFDWLIENHVQVVVTGEMHPEAMLTLAHRICAQLEGGLVCMVE